MNRRLIGTLLAAVLTAGGMVSASQPASAATTSSSGSSCSFTLSKGSGYVGGVLEGWAQIASTSCQYVQSEISYTITANGKCSYKTSKGAKIKGTSKVYAANNKVSARAGYVWVKSGAPVVKIGF